MYTMYNNIKFAETLVQRKTVMSCDIYLENAEKNTILDNVSITHDIYFLFQAHCTYTAMHDLNFSQTTPELSLQVIQTRHKQVQASFSAIWSSFAKSHVTYLVICGHIYRRITGNYFDPSCTACDTYVGHRE